MADGDIVTARFPISGDNKNTEDIAIATQLAALFPVATYDILTTQIVHLSVSSTSFKGTVIVVARAIA